jgi:hypothetical protein
MKKLMRIRYMVIVGTLILMTQALLAAGQSLSWYTLPGGGGMDSAGATYTLSGTVGELDASPQMSGGPFTVTGGFWARTQSPWLAASGLITEQELFAQMQTEIAAHPEWDTGFALVDLVPGGMNLVIEARDGTAIDVIITVIDDSSGVVALQITDITVRDVDEPEGYIEIINLELMPLLVSSLDALFTQKVGVGHNLTSMTVSDTAIDAFFASPR